MNPVNNNIESANSKTTGAIFIMPRSSKAWKGAEALWITVAGWSAAAKRIFGAAWVMTSDTIVDPATAIHFPVGGSIPSKSVKGSWVPTMVKTAAKDFILWRQTRSFRNKRLAQPWDVTPIKFVWEQHDLFAGPGKKLATKLGVPFVLYVHAPVVWEAEKWGVKRPLWGKLLERISEKRSLYRADVVACVSQDVAKKLRSMGIPERKILVSPMAVDASLFGSTASEELKTSLALTGKFVIGWTGSFRSFHGLDLLVFAFAKVNALHPESVLLLVGDGAERIKTEALVQQLKLGDAVRFTGKVSFTQIPKYISMFDLAVVSARSADDFHYSPLKLREYLAAGVPTIAPRAGDMATVFQDEKHLLLYKAGDIDDTATKLLRLMEDRPLLLKLSEAGKNYAMTNCTWDCEVKKLTDMLKANSR